MENELKKFDFKSALNHRKSEEGKDEYLLIDDFEGHPIWCLLSEMDYFFEKYFCQDPSEEYKKVFEVIRQKLPFFDQLEELYKQKSN